jgi:integrase
MRNPALRLVRPTSEKQTVMARRRPNAEYWTRGYLSEHEVELLIEATKGNRQGHRDGTMILLAFRHGLRAAELCDLRWEQIEFETAVLHIRRRKNGMPSVHPLSGRELRALRRLRRETEASPFIFVSERGAPFSVSGLQKRGFP